MYLERHVRAVMLHSPKALTVSQIAAEVSKQIEDDVRAVLNAMVKSGELDSVRGGGGYQSHYYTPNLRRV